jgi:hypothetical protein
MRRTFSALICALLASFVLSSLLLPAARADILYLTLDGLLPSKSDDPVVYPVLQETEWYYGTSWSETLSVLGFVEGKAVEYYRRYVGPGDIRSVEFYAYLFSDGDSAEAYCNGEIDDLRSVIGLSEVSLVGAVGGVYESGGMETGASWGVVSNVVFKVVVYAYIGEDPTDRLVSFTSLELTRIVELGGSSSVPEFSSLIIVPFFVLAVLLAIKLGGKGRFEPE